MKQSIKYMITVIGNAINFPQVRAPLSFSKLYKLVVIGVILAINVNASYALQNSIGAHDPSSIIKDGDMYWIFTTADGIGAKYSTDLIKWTDGKSPFTKTVWPSWISTYAPSFSGTFWAPECIFMNGLYYLYYAAAGGETCIGLCTSPSLNNPVWTDQGVVVSSAGIANCNVIDPDVFFDASGKLWLSFGSWRGGIKMVELDIMNGKPLNTTVFSPCTLFDAENSQVVRNGDYYYMFVNRALCCLDAKSTYYIQVGRSTTPNGVYNEWRTILSTSGNFIGPGGLGNFKEDSTEWATFHYYDGNNNGWPTLAIGKYIWSGGWPTISLDWVNNGLNKITNVNSSLVWADLGCTGATFDPIVQGTWNNLLCQKWDFTQLGNGYYKITCGLGGLSTDALGCSPENGTPMDLYSYWDGACQIWHVERTNTGNYVISSKNGNRVIEVPIASTTPGQQLALWDYNGNVCQHWKIASTSNIITQVGENESPVNNVQILPNPVSNGQFTVKLGRLSNTNNIVINIFDIQGKKVFKQLVIYGSTQILLNINLQAGAYVITLQNSKEFVTQKLLVR